MVQTFVSGRAEPFDCCRDFFRDRKELTLPFDDLRSCSLKNSFTLLSSFTEYSE